MTHSDILKKLFFKTMLITNLIILTQKKISLWQ